MWRKVSNLLKKDSKADEHEHTEPVPALVPGHPRRPQALLNINRAAGYDPTRSDQNADPNRPTGSRPIAVLAQGRVRGYTSDHARSLQNTWQLPVAEITIEEDTDRVTRNENPQYHQHVFLFENAAAAAAAGAGAGAGGGAGGDGVLAGEAMGIPCASLPDQQLASSWREQASKRRKPIPNFSSTMDPLPQPQQAAAASVFPEAAVVPPIPQGIGSQSANFGNRLQGVVSDMCGGGRRSFSSLHDSEKDAESQGSNTTIPSLCLQDETGRRSIGRVRKMQGRSLASANFCPPGGSRRGSVDDGRDFYDLNLPSGPHSLTASTTQLLSHPAQTADGPGLPVLIAGPTSGSQPPQISPAPMLVPTHSQGINPPTPPPPPPITLQSLHLATIQRQKRTFYDRTGSMSSKTRNPQHQHPSRSTTPTKSYTSSTPQSSTTPKRAPPPPRPVIGSGRVGLWESGKRVRSDSYKQVAFPAAHHIPLGSSSSSAGAHLAARETRSVPSLTSSSSSTARPFRSNPLGSVGSNASGSVTSVAPGFFCSESSQLDFADISEGVQVLSPSVFSTNSDQTDGPDSPDGAYAGGQFCQMGEVVAAAGPKGSLLTTAHSIVQGSGSGNTASPPGPSSPHQRRSTLGSASISRRSSETSLSSIGNASMQRRASMHELMTLTSMSPAPRTRPGESSKGSRPIQRVVIPPLRRSVSLKLLSQISDGNLGNTAALSDSQFFFPSTPGLNVVPPVKSVIEISIVEAILPMSVHQHGEDEGTGAVGMYVAVGLNVNVVKRSGVVAAGPEPRWDESLFFQISDPLAAGGRLVVRCVEYNFSTGRAYSAGGATIDVTALYGSHQSKMGKMWVHLSPRAHAPLPKSGVKKRKNSKTQHPPVPFGGGTIPDGSQNSLAAAAAAAANAANAAGRLCIAITHHAVNLRLQVVVDTFPIVLHCNRDDTIASLVVYAQRMAGSHAPCSDWLATRVCGNKLNASATMGEVCQWDDLIVIGPDYSLESWYRSSGKVGNSGGM